MGTFLSLARPAQPRPHIATQHLSCEIENY